MFALASWDLPRVAVSDSVFEHRGASQRHPCREVFAMRTHSIGVGSKEQALLIANDVAYPWARAGSSLRA